MTKRKKHKRKTTGELPCLLFTSQTLALTQKAIIPFEAYVQQRADIQINSLFAKEVIGNLKSKLAELGKQEGWNMHVSFDQNEILILDGSLQLYILELFVSSPKKRHEIEQCRQLCEYFQSLLP